MEKSKIKSIQCVNIKIAKRIVDVYSNESQKKVLYRSFSPRAQFLKSNDQNWLSVDFLSEGNSKVDKISEKLVGEVLEIEIFFKDNKGGNRDTMCHIIMEISDVIKNISGQKKYCIVLKNYSNNAIETNKRITVTDPYEDFPLIDIVDNDFNQVEELSKN